MAYTCYVFDAYGTLFDVHSAVARLCGKGRAGCRPDVGSLAQQAVGIYLDTFGNGAYRDFWQLTEEALDFALAVCPAHKARQR